MKTHHRGTNFLFIYSVVATVFAAMFYIALAVKADGTTELAIDAAARVGGPLSAAFVAWFGVDRTLRNSRRLETLKEWHHNLRWACELLDSGQGRDRILGQGLLDALDDHPLLDNEEQRLIDAVILAFDFGDDPGTKHYP